VAGAALRLRATPLRAVLALCKLGEKTGRCARFPVPRSHPFIISGRLEEDNACHG